MEGVHQLMPPFLTGEKGYRLCPKIPLFALGVSVTLYLLTHLYEISCFLYFYPGSLSLLSMKVINLFFFLKIHLQRYLIQQCISGLHILPSTDKLKRCFVCHTIAHTKFLHSSIFLCNNCQISLENKSLKRNS